VTFKRCVFAIAGAFIFSGAAYAQISDVGDPEAFSREIQQNEADIEASANADPWEGFNRKMFAVNDTMDSVFIVPAAKAYRAVTHKKQRKGIRNFLANARMPIILVNDLLQGEVDRAGETLGRFVINSTIGFGGMGDPAERLGIPQHSEDFGQTLATWGVGSGPYVVLPFFGPSTVRDGFGAAVDTGIDPVFWIRTDPAKYTRYSRAGMTALSVREPLIEPLNDIKLNSLDYYASVRSFYLQSRKREIANGRTTYEDLPDIGEFEEFDEVE
jgi:phospholipid-binding lipoprotein MlaA